MMNCPAPFEDKGGSFALCGTRKFLFDGDSLYLMPDGVRDGAARSNPNAILAVLLTGYLLFVLDLNIVNTGLPIDHAENIGPGNQKYELVMID